MIDCSVQCAIETRNLETAVRLGNTAAGDYLMRDVGNRVTNSQSETYMFLKLKVGWTME